ncbi:virulence factor SrfC family protein, partial [Erwinia amylovora]|uniref:virulence factor SrfC family protein n=1 Tax=Erwinia amylovora TaxID=552 RepID=UPI0020BDE4EA
VNALAASSKGRIECALGNSVLAYASQLNPQQQTANLVLRFRGRQHSSDSRWPVQLDLLTECERVAILALQYHQTCGSHPGETAAFDEQQLEDKVQNV